ncbi:MAG: HAD family hydrolase [Rhizobiaceae bacterium]
MPAPDLVIFDFDGVLVDSEIIAINVESELLTKAGFEISPEEMAERYLGLTFKDILLAAEKDANVPFQASLLEEQRQLLEARLKRELKPIEGADKALALMPNKCICSNSRGERINTMLEKTGLNSVFAGDIFSASDLEGVNSKPAPDVFLHAAEAMNANPANTFVIEDSVHGTSGAVAAGMRVIGFTGGAHTFPGHSDKLTEAGAETVINRWNSFLPVLAALTEWQDA